MALAADGLDAYWVPTENGLMRRVMVEGKDLGFQMRRLGALDMKPAYSVVVPREHSSEKFVQTSVQAKPYAVNGKVTLRIRSKEATQARLVMFRALPDESPLGWPSKAEIQARCADTVRAGGGPVNTIGRLENYYPRLNEKPSRPVSRGEAARAIRECGLSLACVPKEKLRPYAVGEGDRVVSVNLESSNGLPVMGKFEGSAAVKVMALYKLVVKELDEAYKRDPVEGVWDWVRAQEGDPRRSWLVTLLGRCKVDAYKIGKVDGAALRFYNVFPRQLMLRMQQATQVMEEHARGILGADDVYSYTGVSFTHGGADAFVAALDAQLVLHDEAFVHMGDDSMVAVRLRDGSLMLFDLDCSSFDLTQHADVTEEIHAAMRDELTRVDPVAAQLWYALMRTRVVLTMGSIVMRWYHGGPSGAPLQSKVNDALMHVLIRRVLAAVPKEERDEARVAEEVERQGRLMGFRVRMEHARSLEVATVREWLEQCPFLFVGYYLYVQEGRVRVFTDLPRTMGQMVYPNIEHMTKEELDALEPVRLGSLILSMGQPPRHWERGFELLTAYVIGALERAIAAGRVVDAKIARWAVEASGEPEELSLRGLLAAIRRGPDAIWSERVAPPARLVSSPFERAALEARRAVMPPARTRGSDFDAVQHDATRFNAGRPPPDTFWAPDRQPQLRAAERDFVQGEKRRGRKRGARAGVLEQDSDGWSEESDGDSVWEWE